MPLNEIEADIWLADSMATNAGRKSAVVVTTNPIVRSDGALVMGRGIAAEAKAMYPNLPWLVARHVTAKGNVPGCWQMVRDMRRIVTWPVKHHWRDEADPTLIAESAWLLLELADFHGIERLICPRPGCGNGRLKWGQVRKIIEPIVDDRFVFCTHPNLIEVVGP